MMAISGVGGTVGQATSAQPRVHHSGTATGSFTLFLNAKLYAPKKMSVSTRKASDM